MLNKQALNVLLIDDDEEDYILTRDLLGEVHTIRYNVEWKSSYEEGLEEIKKRQHDIYLIDYRLGIENGLDLINQAIFEGIRAPMILLTGQGDQQIDERAMQIGAADYLVKGTFDPALLDRSIRYSLLQFNVLEEVRNLHEQSEQRVKERTEELRDAVSQLEKANQALIDHINERRLAEEALRESQTLLLTMARNFPNGSIAVIDPDWNYIFVEGLGLKDTGFSSADLVGKNIRNFFSQENIEEITEPINDAFRGIRSSFEIKAFDRYLSFQLVPLIDAQSEIRRLMLVSQDITDSKIAENEMENALRKERQLNEMKSRFVSMASHEFRTPLATILSSVALISRYPKTEDEEKRLKHVNRIRAAVTNMTETLNDFLSLDRLDAGVINNIPTVFDLVDFGDDLKEEMQIFARQTIKFNFNLPPGFDKIFLDRQLLKNVVMNLLSNAIKYSPEDSEINVNFSIANNILSVSIIDRGIGIPPADQQHIFNTFFRANNVTNIQGTGLGLNIVKKYLDLMDGNINFTSQLNVGTTFNIQIPVKQQHEEDSADRG